MPKSTRNKTLTWALLGGIAAGVLVLSQVPVHAQSHSGGTGSGHTEDTHAEDTHTGGKGGKQFRGGRGGVTQGGGQSGRSLRDIFSDMEEEAAEEASHGRRGEAGGKGKPPTAAADEGDDISDRPPYAGVPGREGKPGRGMAEPGTKRGDLYGDLWEVLRDPDGVPILVLLPNGEWVVQPVDAEGNSLIQYDASGNVLVDDDGDPVYSALPIEVDLGRLSVGRSPHTVLSTRYEDVIDTINADDVTLVSLDASGRLVLTTTTLVEGDNPATAEVETEYYLTKTIDSPVENLALYYEILTTGGLTGIDLSKLSPEVANLLGDGFVYIVTPDDPDTEEDETVTATTEAVFTVEDFTSAASFLAAASDKTTRITDDSAVYMNSILQITYEVDPDNLPAVPLVLNEDGTVKTIADVAFIDYSTDAITYTYDRYTAYTVPTGLPDNPDTPEDESRTPITVYVLIDPDGDGTFTKETVDLYTAVFGDTNVTATALDAFSQAADDAREVIEYLHEYAIPASSTTN